MGKNQRLKRRLGLNLLVLYGLGNILGAGIYVLIGEVSKESGPLLPFAFILASLVAALSAYSFAKLSSVYPKSGGEAAYVQAAFSNKLLPLVTAIGIALSGIVSSATLSRGFLGYFDKFIPNTNHRLLMLVLIGTMTLLAVNQVDRAVKIASLMTWLEILGLIMVIVSGWFYLDNKDIPINLNLSASNIVDNFGLILSGAFIAFYAYLGFEDMSNIAEEVKSPNKTMPRGIYISLIVAGIIYLSVGLIAQSVLGIDQLSNSTAPLSDVFKTSTNIDLNILGLIGLAAITNGILIQIIMVSRLIYGTNRDHPWLNIDFINKLNRNNVPSRITLISGIVIFLFANLLDLSTLAGVTSTILLIIFNLVNLSLIKLNHNGTIHLGKSIWIPITAIIANTFLILYSI